IYRNHPVAMLAPLTGLAAPLGAWLLSRANRPGLGFVTSGLGITGIVGTAGLSMFPFILPSSTRPGSSLTVWDATSSHLTLNIMFWAVAICLPFVLAYTVWAYAAMWGRVTVEDIESNTHQVY
ncbi:MAG: cytochrome d ubiquinol oxidase subunit II, partial [Hyphomicrobiaceae bacterium]